MKNIVIFAKCSNLIVPKTCGGLISSAKQTTIYLGELMRIGIDIDGVVTDLYAFVADYLTKFLVENEIDYSVSGCDYDFAKIFGISGEIEDKFWDEYLIYYSTFVKARPFVGEVIQKLKHDGHEIIFITARYGASNDDDFGQNMRKLVREFLVNNGIYYDDLIFSKGKNEGKVPEIKEQKIDVMIEDNPRNIEQLSAYCKILCYDAGYNRINFGENVTRVYSWYDIYSKIKSMSKA